jgi:hypothetical protein
LIGALLSILAAVAAPKPAVDYAGDAAALDRIIVENYAYEHYWPGGKLPDSPQLAQKRAAVRDRDGLLRYAEDRLASLADHHAITGSSFRDSWAVIPTYADLWVVRRDSDYVIESVRKDSPAEAAGIRHGDRLVAVGGVPIAQAVASFWRDLGLGLTEERANYAARVLAAGRRDRPRDLTTRSRAGERRHTLGNLYGPQPDRPPVSVIREAGDETVIRLNNSLGDDATIAAFDEAMASIPRNARLIIDLTETPSGGNTTVARAILGWFVRSPRNYQVHRLPVEERQTGIARQWIEQVLPRAGKFHPAMPVVRVGRWTGSMGEGIAIGFAALGARVEGTPMAQLKGAIYDFKLPSSGLLVKIPAERLYSVNGQPREDFRPVPIRKD